MNPLKHIYKLFILVFAVTFMGCDDDEVTPVTEETRMEMLTSGVWAGNKVISDGKDVSEAWKADWDVKKYSFEFFEDGNYIQRYQGMPDQRGTWRFTRGEDFIKFNDAEEVQIKNLTANNLHLIYTKGTSSEEHLFVK